MLLPVLSLKISPVPVPTLAPVVVLGRENNAKPIGSVSTIAVGVLQSQLDPPYNVPDKISTYACPAVDPLAKSTGRVHAPACTTHKPFSMGSVCPVRST